MSTTLAPVEGSFNQFVKKMSDEYGEEHVKNALAACSHLKWKRLKPVFEKTPDGVLIIQLESILREQIKNFNKPIVIQPLQEKQSTANDNFYHVDLGKDIPQDNRCCLLTIAVVVGAIGLSIIIRSY